MTANDLKVSAVPQNKFTVTKIDRCRFLFFRKAKIHIQVVSDDGAQFIVQFGQLSQQLLIWHDEFGEKCEKVELSFFCQPWLLGKINSSIRQMLDMNDPFGFLSKTELVVQIFDLSGKKITSNPLSSNE